MFICSICNKEFEKERQLSGHKSTHNRGDKYKLNRKKKIATNNSDHVCGYCGLEFGSGMELGGHINGCIKNPKYEEFRIQCIKRANRDRFKISPYKKCIKCGSIGSVYIHGKFCKECRMIMYPVYYSYCLFRFNVYKYPDYFDLSLIEKNGWYSPRKNTKGVSRDHIISANYGFINDVDPSIIRHPANCCLMLHLDNTKKNVKCGMTLEELKEKIKIFDRKYNFKGG